MVKAQRKSIVTSVKMMEMHIGELERLTGFDFADTRRQLALIDELAGLMTKPTQEVKLNKMYDDVEEIF